MDAGGVGNLPSCTNVSRKCQVKRFRYRLNNVLLNLPHALVLWLLWTDPLTITILKTGQAVH